MNKAELIASLALKPLKDFSDDDAAAILAIRNEAPVRRNMYTDHLITSDEHQKWLAHMRSREDAEFYAVITKGEIVGAISLDRLDRINRRTDWAFYLSGATQGKGLGSALEFMFLDYVFTDQGFNKLNCEVLAFNTPVIGLHKKFGFCQEGIRRAHIQRGGEAVDTVLLGITAAEWAAARPDIARAFGVAS